MDAGRTRRHDPRRGHGRAGHRRRRFTAVERRATGGNRPHAHLQLRGHGTFERRRIDGLPGVHRGRAADGPRHPRPHRGTDGPGVHRGGRVRIEHGPAALRRQPAGADQGHLLDARAAGRWRARGRRVDGPGVDEPHLRRQRGIRRADPRDRACPGPSPPAQRRPGRTLGGAAARDRRPHRALGDVPATVGGRPVQGGLGRARRAGAAPPLRHAAGGHRKHDLQPRRRACTLADHDRRRRRHRHHPCRRQRDRGRDRPRAGRAVELRAYAFRRGCGGQPGHRARHLDRERDGQRLRRCAARQRSGQPAHRWPRQRLDRRRRGRRYGGVRGPAGRLRYFQPLRQDLRRGTGRPTVSSSTARSSRASPSRLASRWPRPRA